MKVATKSGKGGDEEMGNVMSFKVNPALGAEGSGFEGSPEGMKRNKVPYFFLISLGLWTIFYIQYEG